MKHLSDLEYLALAVVKFSEQDESLTEVIKNLDAAFKQGKWGAVLDVIDEYGVDASIPFLIEAGRLLTHL